MIRISDLGQPALHTLATPGNSLVGDQANVAKTRPASMETHPQSDQRHTVLNPVDLRLFLAIHHVLEDQVTYKWGAKARNLLGPAADIKALDCSGYVQYMLARQHIPAPQGSVEIMDTLIGQGLTRVNLHNVAVAAPRLHLGELYISAWKPSMILSGHIFFTIAGTTYECSKRLRGVSSQPAANYAQHPGLVTLRIPTFP